MAFLIDCDTGHDDALAILTAIAAGLDIVGITTTYGTADVVTTTANTLQVLALSGAQFPVVQGCSRPLIEEPRQSRLHGSTGLDGADMPPPRAQPLAGHAVDFLIDCASARRTDLTIIATAPLTNIALAIRKEPRLCKWISEISIMGGAHGTGNRTPIAEANFASDPEAAAIVLSSGIPLKIVGYDLTGRFGMKEQSIATLSSSGRRVATTVAGLQTFYLARQRDVFGFDYAPVHDCCAVLPYIDPTIVEYETVPVTIELHGGSTRGASIYDHRPMSSRIGTPVNRARSVKENAVIDLITKFILTFP